MSLFEFHKVANSFLEECLKVADTRKPRGVRYPAGFIVFALTMCVSAGRTEQRSMAIWIKAHWLELKAHWERLNASRIRGTRSISQSCISRFLAGFDIGAFVKQMAVSERDLHAKTWENFNKKQKERLQEAEEDGTSLVVKSLPQYCFDGKSRRGCVSPETGRTEIDLTLFCADTNQILMQRTLEDKEGEGPAAKSLMKEFGKELPRGVVTADAGITSPELTETLSSQGQGYFLAIKGNAGKAYDTVVGHDWDLESDTAVTLDKGHGRAEIRFATVVPIEKFKGAHLKKYAGVTGVYEITADVLVTATRQLSFETRYFISNCDPTKISLEEAASYIRDHWRQESYHWVKDVVYKEDQSATKTSNGSRIFSSLRAISYKLGKSFSASAKTFLDSFSAMPKPFLSF